MCGCTTLYAGKHVLSQIYTSASNAVTSDQRGTSIRKAETCNTGFEFSELQHSYARISHSLVNAIRQKNNLKIAPVLVFIIQDQVRFISLRRCGQLGNITRGNYAPATLPAPNDLIAKARAGSTFPTASSCLPVLPIQPSRRSFCSKVVSSLQSGM